MTTTWFKKLILLLAVLVMPLQGVAMASFAKCHEKAAAALAAHDHEHDGGAHHQHDSSDDGTVASMNGHSCGHLVLHVPGSFGIATQPQFAAWIVSVADNYTPYFPEHPRRPPRV